MTTEDTTHPWLNGDRATIMVHIDLSKRTDNVTLDLGRIPANMAVVPLGRAYRALCASLDRPESVTLQFGSESTAVELDDTAGEVAVPVDDDE